MSDGDHCECHEQLCDAGRAKLIAAGRDQGLEAAALAVEDNEIVEKRGNTLYAQLGDARGQRESDAAVIRALKGKP